MSGSTNGETSQEAAAAAEAKLLSDLLRTTREAAGLTRARLAVDLGVPTTQIGDTERGRIRVTALRFMLRHPALLAVSARAEAVGIDLSRWLEPAASSGG